MGGRFVPATWVTLFVLREVLMRWERDFGDGGTSTICRPAAEGEGMSDVCREFGISRKTGYKIFNRYKDDGLEALTDRSQRPPLASSRSCAALRQAGRPETAPPKPLRAPQ